MELSLDRNVLQLGWFEALLDICVPHWRPASSWIEYKGGFKGYHVWEEPLKTKRESQAGKKISKLFENYMTTISEIIRTITELLEN